MMSRNYSEKNQLYNIFFPFFINIFTNAPGLVCSTMCVRQRVALRQLILVQIPTAHEHDFSTSIFTRAMLY